ncbi:MAG: GDSL-type esterase/lipase family protein [Phycisphaerae bacterium]|nr:GDSL-type esterase/lipase family protein [Phycisphaerae bacterium]
MSRLSGRKKAIFSAITVVAFFVLVEAALHLVVLTQPNARLRFHTNLVVQLGFPALNQVLVPDERLFWSLRRSMPPTRLEGRIGREHMLRFTVSTTAKGLRFTPPTTEWRRTIVCLGDSCTFGVGVDDAQTFPAQLQQALPDARCINAGVPAYSLFQGRRWLEAHGDDWKPDAVVVEFALNDASGWDNISDLEHAQRMSASPQRPWDRSRLVQFARWAMTPDSTPRAPLPGESIRPRLTADEFADELSKTIGWCRERGARVVLVVWPARYQLQGRNQFLHQKVLRDQAGAPGVCVVDLLREFPERGGESLYLDIAHVGPEGCRVVAEAVAECLRQP